MENYKNTQSYQSFMKSPERSIKHSTYFDTYDELFAKYRNTEMTFVEIGILGGGSLFMWRDFFGDKARIIGIDLNPNAKKWEDHGFEIYIGSQSSKEFWRTFLESVPKIDVVLDDGGHHFDQQIITCEMLLNSINDGGMIVVEDTHTSYMNEYGPKSMTFKKYIDNMTDNINHRYKSLDQAKAERRVWQVSHFESIVALKISKSASESPSHPVENDGRDDSAIDFSFYDNPDPKTIVLLKQLQKFLRVIPLTWRVISWFLEKIKVYKFKAKEYF